MREFSVEEKAMLFNLTNEKVLFEKKLTKDQIEDMVSKTMHVPKGKVPDIMEEYEAQYGVDNRTWFQRETKEDSIDIEETCKSMREFMKRLEEFSHSKLSEQYKSKEI